jgi:heat-inducible transcriptional repressor
LAEESSNFTILNLLERDFFWKEGWEEILREPEFEEKDLIPNFTELLESFEENIENLKINSGIKIYIGKENPFSKTKDFSIISSKCYLPDDETAVLALLGPKRMDYDRNISLINYLVRALENF